MSVHDPSTQAAAVDASTRRVIAYGISAVFGAAVFLVFMTLWVSDDTAQKGALTVLSRRS